MQKHVRLVISNTKLKERISRKTNPDTIAVLKAAAEHPSWRKLAKVISGGTKRYSSVNLNQIDKDTKEGDIVIVAGKILAEGDITKKVRICALAISNSAKEKLKKTKSEFVSIADEIKKNPKAEGVKFIQ